jgi:tetratricopeptide (TPR) repeat protein
MNNFIIYSLEAAISLALFYLVYWVFLKKETFFRLNRFYLLFSAVVSLLLPLLNYTVATNTESESFITRYLVLPVERYEQNIIETINGRSAFGKEKTMSQRNLARLDNQTPANVENADSAQLTGAGANSENSSRDNNSFKNVSRLTFVIVIYLTGAGLLFIRFIVNFIWIFGYTRKHTSQYISGMKVIRLEKNTSPFSFLNFIFINNKNYPEAELNRIISHEKVHITQRHSLDLILFELVLVFQWFNPFTWCYKRSVKITHEYLADQGTVGSGVDLPGYQYSLLNHALSENDFEIASTYNLSIKNRIEMMMKKRSQKLSALKLAVVLPLLVFLFSAFAFNTKSSVKEMKQTEKNKLIVDDDAPIKKINVTREYLKLLEGEYVSTNEPGRVRKIKFEDVLGTLMGSDDGYTYMLTPVAEGKFINPDDKASLIFDTKNKDAITLLLFGTIKLNKVKDSGAFPKKSVAYEVADVMEKSGIAAAVSHYKEIKTADKYDLNEGEMNYVGYLLLWLDKPKEAVEVFKLNTEAFPESFNVYDSYAEALLAAGDKTNAKENYIKSVKINPGSKSGITHLKELGVNTDALITKVSVSEAYLELLRGEYISTNDPHGIRKIRFTVVDGVLEGNDRGYHYKLMPMGDEKFVNPDDGASLVFDSKDKNAISLLLFGKITLKKVKEESIQPVSVTLEYLKMLEGEYISTDQPNRVRKITFVEENGVLVGNDNGYRYKLVPVGDGKFINPDDDATLEFNTVKKNAITLLLFGKIHLKKVK